MKHNIKSMTVGVAVLVLMAAASSAWAQTLVEVTGFGSNPGNLQMFKYVPNDLPANSPLVVALHGCKQSASDYDEETGWVKFAEKERFALLLPQQRYINNFTLCFNWFEADDIRRDRGESLSIRQMIDKMKKDHATDPQRTYVTGLSAGGAMTAVMLAAYPEIFAGGAIIAGLPYGCAANLGQALGCMSPGKDLTAETWGSLVRSASSHSGPWPRVSIWHGTADSTVAPMNARELVDQWTDVHGIDQIADGQETVKGHSHRVFKDSMGTVLVETHMIADMAHGTPVSPGSGDEQCGTPGSWILDAGICSSFHIARFWDLLGPVSSSHTLREQLLEQVKGIKEKLNELEATIEQVAQ